ncbi:unnamed protein product [Calypogeia fissa]
MPKLTIYQKHSLESEGKQIVGTLSYKLDETYADARRTLERLGYFPFQFDFVEDSTNMLMGSAWEAGVNLEDSGNNITIIARAASRSPLHPNNQPGVPMGPGMGPGELHRHRGPDASSDPSTWDLQFTEDSMISPRRGQTGAQGREPTLPADPPVDPHVSL